MSKPERAEAHQYYTTMYSMRVCLREQEYDLRQPILVNKERGRTFETFIVLWVRRHFLSECTMNIKN